MSKEGNKLIGIGINLEVKESIENTFTLFETMINHYIDCHKEVKKEYAGDDTKDKLGRLMSDSSIHTLEILLKKVNEARERILHD